MTSDEESSASPKWMEAYVETDNLNEKYKLLRDEMTRLRGEAGGGDRFDPNAVAQTIHDLAERVDGQLLVFAANDFGLPIAFRPTDATEKDQAAVRNAILEEKYDEHQDLNEIRQALLEAHPAVHKAIVVECTEDVIRYHLPEGSNTTTNFLTVREMVGLVDYTTNSFQSDGLSRTY